jgi:hypothetical protein
MCLHPIRLADFKIREDSHPVLGALLPSSGSRAHKVLSEGAFDIVTHVWDVSADEEYAPEEPSSDAIRKNKVGRDEWWQEGDITGRITHVSWHIPHYPFRPNTTLGVCCSACPPAARSMTSTSSSIP